MPSASVEFCVVTNAVTCDTRRRLCEPLRTLGEGYGVVWPGERAFMIAHSGGSVTSRVAGLRHCDLTRPDSDSSLAGKKICEEKLGPMDDPRAW